MTLRGMVASSIYTSCSCALISSRLPLALSPRIPCNLGHTPHFVVVSIAFRHPLSVLPHGRMGLVFIPSGRKWFSDGQSLDRKFDESRLGRTFQTLRSTAHNYFKSCVRPLRFHKTLISQLLHLAQQGDRSTAIPPRWIYLKLGYTDSRPSSIIGDQGFCCSLDHDLYQSALFGVISYLVPRFLHMRDSHRFPCRKLNPLL
ncbi:hypothetical protein BJX76DRAFT_330805 [Aspergillus varians]